MFLTFPSVRPPSLLVGAVAVLGLLTGCGGVSGGTASDTARPSASGTPTSPAPAAPSASSPASPSATAPASSPASAPESASAPASAPAGARCRTFELNASLGTPDFGAGQRNFPIVLTNTSSRSCTVYGFPGAAFADAAGRQLGPDPERGPESPARVTLAPGGHAWAGLSYSNPELSGAPTATPAALMVTPPDEREPLRVPWTAGAVPVGGAEGEVTLTPFRAGTAG